MCAAQRLTSAPETYTMRPRSRRVDRARSTRSQVEIGDSDPCVEALSRSGDGYHSTRVIQTPTHQQKRGIPHNKPTPPSATPSKTPGQPGEGILDVVARDES